MSIEIDETAAVMPGFTKTDREAFAAFVLRARASGYGDPELIQAMEAVQRRGFVPAKFQDAAWSGRSVPIGCGEVLEGIDLQAQMIAALKLTPKMRVLEIGTGSGYTSSVMGHLAGRVYTMDRYAALQHDAHLRHRALKLDNVIASHGDGMKGSSEGPFDRIIAWAAFDTIPRPFIEQLVSTGQILCAIGEEEQPQKLHRLTKVGSRFEAEELFDVRFQMMKTGTAKAL